MVCVMEDNEREEAAEAAALLKKSLEAAGECDCGCDALAKYVSRGKQLQAKIKPGSQSSSNEINEIKSMSTCFQTCMSEFMNCKQ